MTNVFDLRSIEVLPPLGSPLSLIIDKERVPLTLPTDSVIGYGTFITKQMEFQKVLLLAKHAANLSGSICLIDVGANVGLFSRQCAAKIETIGSAFLYEPHPLNFEFLKRNIAQWDIEKRLVNAALSDVAGNLDFFEDETNCGNYSLNESAVPGSNANIKVVVLSAQSEEMKWVDSGMPIYYKSDTQGFDEKIATALSMHFWHKVNFAVFELWRIQKPPFDVEKFREILTSFPNRRFEDNINENLEPSAVLSYLSGDDRNHKDLICWR
jgi:FkbM family methyltransferase